MMMMMMMLFVAASRTFQESIYPFLAVILPLPNGATVEVGRIHGWHGMFKG